MIEGNYTDIIGKRVHVIVDRPAGSFHPRNHDIFYMNDLIGSLKRDVVMERYYPLIDYADV